MRTRESGRSTVGYFGVLIGALGFVWSSFLRLYRLPLAPARAKFTLYNQIVSSDVRVGGWIFLFGGVGTVAVISIVGALRPRSWTRVALLAAMVTWSLTMVGLLMVVASPASSVSVGFWALVASVACVVAGAIVVLASRGWCS